MGKASPFGDSISAYQLIRVRISFICSPRRGRTVALHKKRTAYIKSEPHLQMSWWGSHDTKVSTSCPTDPPLPTTQARAVSNIQMYARDASGTRKCSSVHVRMRPQRARDQTRNQHSARPTRLTSHSASKQGRRRPTSAAARGAAGSGGPELIERGDDQVDVAADRT